MHAGFDVPLGGGSLFNAGLKKVKLAADTKSNGKEVGELKVDPTLFSVGFGKRF